MSAISGHARSAVARGVEFLQRRQLPDGGFLTAHTTDAPEVRGRHHSAFATALVVSSLGALSDEPVRAMVERGIDSLVRERLPSKLWRYLPDLDPDLDTTCCSAYAIERLRLSPARAADVEAILGNRNAKGLFHTWVRSPDRRNDVDGAVNANVIRYLGEGEAIATARNYLADVIVSGRELDACWYYTDAVVLDYFVARAAESGIGGLRLAGESFARGVRAKVFPNALIAAMALSATFAFGRVDDDVTRRAVDRIACEQREDGSWPLVPFIKNAGPVLTVRRNAMLYSGSEELSTAFCLEALARIG